MTDYREPEPLGPDAARPGHNYVAAVCRNALRDDGRDPAGREPRHGGCCLTCIRMSSR